jgi:tRNA pseudouridine38-40 synthase
MSWRLNKTMRLWKLLLTYDGTSFHGWQVQPGLSTVQGTLARAIEHVTGETVLPQGSGRTDTGVHALGQVASFALDAPIPAANLQRALNRALPPAIRVLAAEVAEDGFHARHCALGKTYEYRIFPRLAAQAGEQEPAPESICPPMLAPFVWDCPWPLDLERMQQAAACVLGTHDFSSFAASDPDRTERRLQERLELQERQERDAEPPTHFESNIRRIDASCWHRQDGLLLYRVTGSGFLHHMIRNLVGTFVDAGAGRIAPEAVRSILAARDRSAAGATAPARGLFLISVAYASERDERNTAGDAQATGAVQATGNREATGASSRKGVSP